MVGEEEGGQVKQKGKRKKVERRDRRKEEKGKKYGCKNVKKEHEKKILWCGVRNSNRLALDSDGRTIKQPLRP